MLYHNRTVSSQRFQGLDLLFYASSGTAKVFITLCLISMNKAHLSCYIFYFMYV